MEDLPQAISEIRVPASATVAPAVISGVKLCGKMCLTAIGVVILIAILALLWVSIHCWRFRNGRVQLLVESTGQCIAVNHGGNVSLAPLEPKTESNTWYLMDGYLQARLRDGTQVELLAGDDGALRVGPMGTQWRYRCGKLKTSDDRCLVNTYTSLRLAPCGDWVQSRDRVQLVRL
jgi:hypothetical protein